MKLYSQNRNSILLFPEDFKIYNNIEVVYESLQKVNDLTKQTLATNIAWLIQKADIRPL